MKILDWACLILRKATEKKKSENDKDNCNLYMAGGCGTNKTPEVLSVQPIGKTRATFSKKKVTPKFIDERFIVCVNVLQELNKCRILVIHQKQAAVSF